MRRAFLAIMLACSLAACTRTPSPISTDHGNTDAVADSLLSEARFQMYVALDSAIGQVRNAPASEFSAALAGYSIGVFEACMHFVNDWDRCTEVDEFKHLFDGYDPHDSEDAALGDHLKRDSNAPGLPWRSTKFALDDRFSRLVDALCKPIGEPRDDRLAESCAEARRMIDEAKDAQSR